LVIDLDATGDDGKANQLRKDTQAAMQKRLGMEHPETIQMSMGKRGDCDIELPAS
jgi:hypothetical protein